jgi:hypothetical protein
MIDSRISAGLALALLASPALADIEITAGASRFGAPPDSLWWQSGFEHKLDLTSPTIGIGWTNGTFRVGYQYDGHVTTSAIAMLNEAAWFQGVRDCSGKPGCSRFDGTGTAQEIHVTWTPHIGHAFLEIGPTLMRTTWTERITDLPITAQRFRTLSEPGVLRPQIAPFSAALHVGALLGVGYDFGRMSIAATYRTLDARGGKKDDVPAGFRHEILSLELRGRF